MEDVPGGAFIINCIRRVVGAGIFEHCPDIGKKHLQCDIVLL